jgi:hypothetical protein
VAVLLAAALVTVAALPVSNADDVTSLMREVSGARDFRLRAMAALSLGNTRNTAALAPLAAALDDAHPAVRAAAAAALGALGRREALDPLRYHLAGEPFASVQSQIRRALQKLTGVGRERVASAGEERAKGTTVLVKLGQLRNLSGVRGLQVADLFRGATRERAAELPGVELLAEGTEGPSEAQLRKLPLLLLDGSVNRLAQGARGERNVTVSAQVEYTFRKVPEHALRGTVTGAAQARGGGRPSEDGGAVADLEDQALRGAVDSAMRGAPEVMLAALK